MRIARSASVLVVVSLFSCSSPANEAPGNDRLGAQIQRLREGKKVTLTDAEFYKLRSASAYKYYNAAAELYVDNVKWSIVYPDKQGGWPARSPVMAFRESVEQVYQRLKENSDQTNDPIFDYALLYPTLYLGKEDEMQRLLSRLKKRDPFLYGRAADNMKWWKDFAARMLQCSDSQSSKKDTK